MRIKIQVSAGGRGLPVPEYASPGSSGLDLRAATEGDILIEEGGRVSVPVGFHMELPEGYEAQVRPRSGLALDHGITILNSPGTVDSDYRGEIRATLVNLGSESFTIRRGDRIAQMVISRVTRVELEEVNELGGTERGEGGFGHTGV